MSRFSTYGQADSQMQDELDAGFLGFNNRNRPDQLKSGILADSQNGRMDLNGEWQVRKGIEVISGSILTASTGVTLPFDTDDGSPPAVNDVLPRIQASCAYSNPNDTSGQFIVLATSSEAVLVNLEDGTSTALAYPGTEEVLLGASLIQALEKVILFRAGDTPLLWDGNPANDFVKAESGTYIQPVRLGNAGANTVIADGVVTVTSDGHGLFVGDSVVVTESSNNLTVGDEFDVATVPSVDTFTFFAEVDDDTSHNNHYTEPVSKGIGYIRMPAPPFGIYHGKRLAVPYEYTVESTTDTYTDRGIKDQVILSNGLDPQTFDDVPGKFRMNAGTADFIVGLHSFADDALLVFNRNSIHLISGTSRLVTASQSLITDEVGCVAKNSIVQVGNNLLFLSDNGVYGLSFQDLYNLRGNDYPLSEPIDKTIQNINKDAWSKSVGVYHDNKYYLAVPIGEGVNFNNKIIIYNFLNKQWESIDSVDKEVNFDFENLIVAGDGLTRGVYAINAFGGVHRLDDRLDGIDRITADPSTAGLITTHQISSEITTRKFTLQSIDRKKWNSFEISTQSSPEKASDFEIFAETENIDYNLELGLLSHRLPGTNPLEPNEDVSIRGRIGNSRAYAIQFNINNIVGRPKIRSLKVTGAQAFRSTNTAI
tara:strand:- start:2196 stop:4151 length:1956 start_codon:yes stop_codon:yes gene_type:complete